LLFNSVIFVAFFAVVYGLYRSLPHRAQNRMLLVASYVFYGSWDWRFLSLIWISTIVDYFCGRAIHRCDVPRARRGYLALSVATNLALLGFFKYFNFFSENLQALAQIFGLTLDRVTLAVILPVGISFYTFQTLSYSIDIYRGELKPERSFLDFALFVAFFPQLVAGPIERARRLLPQIREPRRIRAADVESGLWCVFWGFFLKTFVADNLAPIVNVTFRDAAAVEGAQVLVAVYAFAFQIFGDFAGYSSIAIGLGKLMGFHLMTNFRFPYFVTNPRDFWRNWHISLSTWLRDYLYIPLGGSHGSRFLLYRNLFLTMLLGGLWHGAAWTFVLWGAYQGAILMIHRMATRDGAAAPPSAGPLSWAGRIARPLFMFQVTCLGWLIFRAESMTQLGLLLSALLTDLGAPSRATVYHASQLLFYTWLLLLVQVVQRWTGDDLGLLRLPDWIRVPVTAAMFYSLLVWGAYGGQEFIYFQF
jgi:D-alanyl-lipoteichoic acid acyltransferase DltB (MBOAT superfamily)